MAIAFQRNAFQRNAFQIGDQTAITSTQTLQLPVNCVLAGSQPIVDRYREWSVPPSKLTATPRRTARRTSVQMIGGNKPSFTVTSSRRGYD